MSNSLVIPKYEPRCERCGHTPTVHTTTKCANYYQMIGQRQFASCDCPGWKRDEAWPPPIVVTRVA